MRPILFDTMLAVARQLAMRAECQKRQVGCVLLDKQLRIIGSGYNGRPRGMSNCTGSDVCRNGCEGVHAEINALLQCKGDDVTVAIVTHAPCWHCTKALINTACHMLYFGDASTADPRAETLWLNAGRAWQQAHTSTHD